ncbi:MAG TPA: TPM domain-containing protein [Flavobacteriaceae bacterium]|nr:TPM domain-containing protein [Flavobacteriaceae bacterium]
MTQVKRFLSKKDEEEIVNAIREAEKKTSGEIRVHIERHTEMDPFDHAVEVFHQLKMDNTKLQNGVLIYLAIDDRNLVILGDKGINEAVPTNFWETTKDLMLSHFKKGDFKQGLIDGILMAGEQLQSHFPWDANSDIDELPNEISR